jgi:two-component system, LytTR family, response regulator LytT
MTAIVIEDEIPAGKRLEKLLIAKGFKVLAFLATVQNALHWLASNQHPDLVFMDIKLRDGSCFRILDKVQIKSKIVFTTAYDEFALKAFNYNAIDYLLKPIDESKLDKMITKLNALTATIPNAENWSKLEENLENKYKTSFLVAIGNKIKKIDNEQIICFFSEANSSFILTNENRQFIINSSLDSLEQQLHPNSFFRINRKSIINKKFVSGYTSRAQLVLQIPHINDFEFVVSRMKTKAFLDWFK